LDVQELLAYLLLVEAGFVEPGVAFELLNGVSVFSVVAKQLEDHVLEVS